jgi:hypothetical protein
MRVLRGLLLSVTVAVINAQSSPTSAADTLEVGMGVADVTPELTDNKPIWLAGKESNRAATGVHDRLFARAVVLRAGGQKIALVSVDSIGLSRPTIEAARARVQGFSYVLVASTHSHDSPDVIGVWGPSPGETGVVPDYLRQVEEGIAAAVRDADKALTPARAEYGTAEDENLLGDFRLPEVYDGVLRLLRFARTSDGKTLGLIVQWNSHGVEPKGKSLVSRDMMGVVVDTLEKRHSCPVIYFQGAIGGLMGTPSAKYRAAGRKMPDEAFAYIQVCGEDIADLADRALKHAEPITLTPLAVFTRAVMIPLSNEGYRMARAAGVLPRPAYVWPGQKYGRGVPLPPGKVDGEQAMETEVAYLRLGELDIAAIPGELYPELVYGKFQEPADPGADFPTAPLETPVAKILPRSKFLLLGLANDEVGYILPKRQWDVAAPFAYGRASSQYGEKNSVGPDTAAALLEALADRVAESKAK